MLSEYLKKFAQDDASGNPVHQREDAGVEDTVSPIPPLEASAEVDTEKMVQTETNPENAQPQSKTPGYALTSEARLNLENFMRKQAGILSGMGKYLGAAGRQAKNMGRLTGQAIKNPGKLGIGTRAKFLGNTLATTPELRNILAGSAGLAGAGGLGYLAGSNKEETFQPNLNNMVIGAGAGSLLGGGIGDLYGKPGLGAAIGGLAGGAAGQYSPQIMQFLQQLQNK